MLKAKSEYKTFNMRMDRDLYIFIKKHAADNDIPMAEIMISCAEKYRKRIEARLTPKDINV